MPFFDNSDDVNCYSIGYEKENSNIKIESPET